MTGGHAASSAFVVIEEIRRQKKAWDIYWIGFKSSIEGERVSTLSSIYFPKYNIKTYSLFTGRIQRRWTIHTIPSLIKIPFGFLHALWLLLKIKPDLVLSFGGFSAFPVVVVAFAMGVPVIIHEQTSVVGRANKLSSFFAKKIAISRETSRAYFPKGKTVLTGNPVPRGIVAKNRVSDIEDSPQILVTGGQSGSVAVNEVVANILPKLLEKYKVVHLTGLMEEKKFKSLRRGFDVKLKDNYYVHGIVDPKEYDRLFKASSILISRAGANTVSKIIASRKASILIPLPISYLDEQKKNAQFAKKYGGARILEQEGIRSADLLKGADYLIKSWDKISSKLEKIKNPDIKAAENIVSLVQENIK